MDKEIAKLIEEYGTEPTIWEYLRLRAHFSLKNEVDPTIITKTALNDLVVSGFVLKDGDQYSLEKEDQWAYLPPETKKREPKEGYIPYELKELCETVGYPMDWGHKQEKYRAMYFRMKKKHKDLVKVAKWVSENHPEYDLTNLLTGSFYDSFKSQMSKPAAKLKEEYTHEEF